MKMSAIYFIEMSSFAFEKILIGKYTKFSSPLKLYGPFAQPFAVEKQ